MMNFPWVFSLSCFCLTLVAGAKQERYTMEINEKGSKFNEVVEVNERKKTVVYNVPKHNDIPESHVLVDYKKGILVTRMPELKECYISKIDKNEPSLSETRMNMQLRKSVARENVTVAVKTETDVMMKIRKMNPRNLSPKVLKFCGENQVYLVKHVPLEQFMSNSTSKGSRVQKRSGDQTYTLQLSAQGNALFRASYQQAYTCKRMSAYLSVISGCVQSGGRIQYGCGPRGFSCRYLAICNPVSQPGASVQIQSAKIWYDMECTEKHKFTYSWCCDLICT